MSLIRRHRQIRAAPSPSAPPTLAHPAPARPRPSLAPPEPLPLFMPFSPNPNPLLPSSSATGSLSVRSPPRHRRSLAPPPDPSPSYLHRAVIRLSLFPRIATDPATADLHLDPICRPSKVSIAQSTFHFTYMCVCCVSHLVFYFYNSNANLRDQ